MGGNRFKKRKKEERASRAAEARGDGQDADEEGRPGKCQKTKGMARNDSWKEESGSWAMENEAYELYYKHQKVCPAEEWPQLIQALRTGLPLGIRVNPTRVGGASISERLKEMRLECPGTDMEHLAPEPLTWYAAGSAWHWRGLERRTVKKDKRHTQLKAFLIGWDRCGLITRQEVVSMIPPLFLGVEPDHLVLDLCAAPGSKTSQMLEFMHAGQKGRMPKGLILANDVQWKRANMLAHQVQRIGSPCTAVVNMDAQFFPELWERSPPEQQGHTALKFDRVLADVPCSGDGTMRKTPFIWRSWTLLDGMGLHVRQLCILQRGLDLLKVGGRLVYSTCSLNPMEDEAVVSAALQKHGAAVALVSPPNMPGFKAAQGVSTWIVQDGDGSVYRTWEDVPKERREGKNKVMASMFPPTGEEGAAITASLHAHCRRMLPHLMDTGGFFAAVLEKRSELKPSARERREARKKEVLLEKERQEGAGGKATDAASPQASDSKTGAESPGTAGGGEPSAKPSEPQQAVAGGGGEEARTAPQGLKPLTKEYRTLKDEDKELWEEIAAFYGFEASLAKHFVMRAKTDNQVFLLSEGVQRLLASETRMPTRMVLAGVSALRLAATYHERACPWRLDQQGILAVSALGLRRRLVVSRAFMARLLREKEFTLAEVRAAAAEGGVRGLEALCAADGGAPQPGSLAVELDPEACGPSAMLAVAAEFSEESLELAVGSAAESAALLQEVEGMPTVAEILRAPPGEGGSDDEGAAGEAGGAEDEAMNTTADPAVEEDAAAAPAQAEEV